MLIMHKDKTNFGFMILEFAIFLIGLKAGRLIFFPQRVKDIKVINDLKAGGNFLAC